SSNPLERLERERIFDLFRRWGYLEADLDPLGIFKPLKYPDLQITGSVAEEAREIYCGTIGADFMHLMEPDRRQWIIERIENIHTDVDQNRILERLVRADLFEQVLQARYLGTKRFSLEGVTALIPLLDSILEVAGESGALDFVLAMSHRGRLNVMVHAACKLPHEVVSGFEDVDPRSVLGAGDVKYHVGATGCYVTTHGKSLNIHIVSTPSHLEAVGPGVRIGRLAAEYRAKFGSDVVVDLIGYRRHGHSEVDDPTITQPQKYDAIKNHASLWKIYAEKTGIDATAVSESVRKEYEGEQTKAKSLKKMPHLRQLPDYWNPYLHAKSETLVEPETGVAREKLEEITDGLMRVPEGFHLHPKLAKLLEQRAEMGHGKRAIDYGFAEALAFASLVLEGTPIRLTGQDTQRGTFNQRHAVLIDTETEHNYLTLSHLSRQQAFCEIHNSPLSEAACVGFEYGFSRDYPEALVLWEAQFGDFVNGAQVIIDQFLSATEDKWNLPTGLVLLLPHGYEGQGPEHSSARIERFLQLAAEDNLQICQPSNAAQYFHMLRRQARRVWRKPLIVFTPKSMLRHPDASSGIEDFTAPRFLPLVPDREIQDAKRILIASG